MLFYIFTAWCHFVLSKFFSHSMLAIFSNWLAISYSIPTSFAILFNRWMNIKSWNLFLLVSLSDRVNNHYISVFLELFLSLNSFYYSYKVLRIKTMFGISRILVSIGCFFIVSLSFQSCSCFQRGSTCSLYLKKKDRVNPKGLVYFLIFRVLLRIFFPPALYHSSLFIILRYLI